jgi:hypothetical protein
MKKIILILAGCFAMAACNQSQHPEIEHGTFLKGDMEHFVETIEEQFAGFSATMREVSYRYEELYWAGLDGNWEYADYQLEHIEEALEAGIIRRPERALNAELFLKTGAQSMQVVIDNKDGEAFEQGFNQFRTACLDCHMREKVEFIPVGLPEIRAGITHKE